LPSAESGALRKHRFAECPPTRHSANILFLFIFLSPTQCVLLNLFKCTFKRPAQIHSKVHIRCLNEKYFIISCTYSPISIYINSTSKIAKKYNYQIDLKNNETFTWHNLWCLWPIEKVLKWNSYWTVTLTTNLNEPFINSVVLRQRCFIL